jgi:hypothetical protein
MKTSVLFCFLTISFLINSCSQKTETEKKYSIKTFVFSNQGMSFDYSLKINGTDTIYRETRFPFPEISEYGILKKEDKDSVMKMLEEIDFSKYKHRYEDNHLQDGQGYRFIIKSENKVDSVYVYGHEAPEQFYALGKKIKMLKDKVEFKKLNSKIDFENLNYKMLPPPPKIENGKVVF